MAEPEDGVDKQRNRNSSRKLSRLLSGVPGHRFKEEGMRQEDDQPLAYYPKPFAPMYAWLLVAGVAAAIGVYAVLVSVVPGMDKDRADTMKTALLVVGGSGALAALYVSYRKQRNARFGRATFREHPDFNGATFRRDHPPRWPDGFAEPAEIVWEPAKPLAPASGPKPEPPATA